MQLYSESKLRHFWINETSNSCLETALSTNENKSYAAANKSCLKEWKTLDCTPEGEGESPDHEKSVKRIVHRNVTNVGRM